MYPFFNFNLHGSLGIMQNTKYGNVVVFLYSSVVEHTEASQVLHKVEIN